MNTVMSRPLSLVRFDFHDLYARHLCRHSQLGINVAHLAALLGTWYGVFGMVWWLCHLEWVIVMLAVAYWAVVAVNVPARVAAACALFMALFVVAVLGLPELPVWVYAIMVPLFYKLQSWSHRVWTVERDMTEFNKRYPKGFTLFVVLLFYEVPMVLHFLLFGRRDWAA
jgi:hypothetical protein